MGTRTGTVESHWRKQDGAVYWTVVVPANSTPGVRFPKAANQKPPVLTAGKHHFQWRLEEESHKEPGAVID